MEIVELRSPAELKEGFPVMRELRTHLDEQQYLTLLGTMMPNGYRLFGVRDAGTVQAVAGIALCTNLYNGRHVWVYDLVTRASARSKGYGRRLLSYVEDFARREGCAMVALNSGLQRVDAHRFYEAHMGYDRVSYSFTKALPDSSDRS